MIYKKYYTNKNNFMNVLEEYGVCVINNIFSEDECIDLRDKIWNSICDITKKQFNIDDVNTWENYYKIMLPYRSMMLQYFYVAHIQGVWDVRQDERVGEIFEKIWKVDKHSLLSSFDGIAAQLPPEITGKGWLRNSEDWYHTDQSSKKIGMCCIQSMINLYPVNVGDATLTILEKSHKYHQSFFQEKKYNTLTDWYKLTLNDMDYFNNKGCVERAIMADIGAIILWDSRTFHQAIKPNVNRKKENFRMVIYTCLLPRDTYTQTEIKKRKKAFHDMRITNHWGTKLFPSAPNTYGKPILPHDKPPVPVLSEYGKQLIA